jgi:hypothetical protein
MKTPLDRRALIKWTLGAGAALGLARSQVLQVLEDAAGPSVAHAAEAITTRRSVHIRAGIGGFAWFQLLWPHNAIAAAASDTFAWHAPGQHQLVAGTTRPLTRGPQTPFAALPPARQMTAIMAGDNETHEANPVSIARALNGSSMFALAAALQSVNPCVVPVIAIGDLVFGSAPGAPAPAVVPTGADIVGLFNSVASRAGGLLADPARADTYRAGYAALAGLNRAADRSTTRTAYATGRAAARFVGTNFAARLAITPADLTRYGLDAGGVPDDVAELGRTLIVTAKAFQMQLTQSVLVPGPRDDPHGAFADPAALVAKVTALGRVLDAFMADLEAITDDAGARLADRTIITIDGDTPKTPLDRNNWLDPTPGNSNWMYVWGGGLLATGWFGGIAADGTVTGFDPVTGADAPPDRGLQAQAAVAAVAYAIADGNADRVAEQTRVDYTGLVAPPA